MSTSQPGLGYKGAILGIGEETTWGTEAVRDKAIEMSSDGLSAEEARIHSNGINARYEEIDEAYQGKITAGGDVGFDCRYEGDEYLYKHALGSVTTTEQTAFTVSSSNKYFDFKEDGGGALLGTVAEASYLMGETSATAGTLCEAIKTALEANGAGTYTVTFSNTTKKITIAVAGGIAATQFLWKTGTHGSDNADDHIGTLIGFDDAADGSSVASVVADNAVITVFQHLFKISDTILEGLTLEKQIDDGLTTGKGLIYTGSRINSMDFNIAPGELLTSSVNVISREEAIEDTLTSLTLSTKAHIPFHQATVTLNSNDISSTTSAFNFSINNNLKGDRDNLGSRNIYQPLPQSKVIVEGSLTVEWDASTYYTVFRNMTTYDLLVAFTGAEIKTGFNYSISFDFNQLKTTGSSPSIADPSIVYQEIPFKAYAVDTSNREVEITIQNTISSI